MNKHVFHTVTAILMMTAAVIADAQTDAETCPRAVEQAAELVRGACADLEDGQACVGSGLVSATATSDIADFRFANPGDRASLSDIQRFQTRSMTADSRAWTTVTARLQSITVDGAPTTIHMLVMGDAEVWQDDAAPQTEAINPALRPAAISTETSLIVRGNASEAAENVWELNDGEIVSAIGRSGDEQWIRILLPSPNGGAGWVLGRYITVDGGSESLPVHINASPIPTPAPQPEINPMGYPSYRMKAPILTSEDCPGTPASGLLLQASTAGGAAQASFNDVLLQFSGTVFLSEQADGKLAFHNLEGETRLQVDVSVTALPPWTASEVLMDASYTPAAVPSPPQLFSPSLRSALGNLPFELLARDISPAFSLAEKPVVSPPLQCPGMVQEAYEKSAMFCQNLDVDTACIGNAGQGMLRASPSAGAGSFSFAQPGDRVSLSQIERLSTNVGDDAQGTWPTAVFQIAVDTPSGAEASATMILVGEVELSSKTETASQPAAELVEDATGFPAQIRFTSSVSVRAEPRVDTEPISALEDGTSVLALDKSFDQQWIRIETPDGIRGWVIEDFVQLSSGIESLPVFSAAAARETATDGAGSREGLSAFDFISRDAYSNCGEAPPSGLLLQSPRDLDEAITLRVNGLRLELNGTAFLTAAEDALTLYSMEGASSLSVPGADIALFTGDKMTLPLAQGGGLADNAVPIPERYSAEESMRLAALPLRLLPRGIDSGQPDEEESELPSDEPVPTEEEAAGEAAAAEPVSEPMDVEISVAPAEEQEACMISAGGLARNIREGPGTDFRAVDVLRPGQTVQGNTQKRGTHGLYWYHTDRGWIRFDAGEITGPCDSLPLHQEVIQAQSQTPEDVTPPLTSELYGDVCAVGGVNLSATVQGSGSRYYEFGGLWVGQEGTSATFSAHAPYYHKSFGNVIAFIHPDGNLWLGSEEGKVFTINFAAEINFRVRVSGLVGDRVSLNVRCG